MRHVMIKLNTMESLTTAALFITAYMTSATADWGPTIRRCPDTSTVHVGDTITWTCDAGPNVQSYKWNGPIRYRTASFTKKVATSDSGDYRCQVKYSWDEDLEWSDWSSKEELRVKAKCLSDPPGKPTLLAYPSGPVDVDDFITMVCQPDPDGGRPTSYEWFAFNSGYSPQTTEILYRRKVKLSDNGKEYACRARNADGDSLYSEIKKLVVKDPPSIPIIAGWPDTSSVNVGDRLVLECVARTVGGTNITYGWLQDRMLIQGQSGSRYTIDRVRKGDAGKYQCIATSDMEKTSPQRTLSVKDGRPGQPQINLPSGSPGRLYVGKQLSLTCTNRTGGAPTSYKWYKGARELKGSNKQEYRKNITLDDGGEYRCQAVNDDGATFSAIKDIVVWQKVCSDKWTEWLIDRSDTDMERRSKSCVDISSKGEIAKWNFLWDSRPRQDAAVWDKQCSEWTEWLIDPSDTSIERRYKSCEEISSKGEIANRGFRSENRTRQVSTIDASFHSKKTFTETLRNKSSDAFKKLSTEFLPLLEKAYNDGTDVGKLVKEITISHFTEGSVVVHYKLVLTGTLNATDPLLSPGKVSQTLDKYLESNPDEAKRYGVDPSSEKSTGGSNSGQQSNQANLILGVTLTIITFLVITIVVLVVFLIRMKRQLPKSSSTDGSVGFQARSGGVTMHGSQAQGSNPYGFNQGLSGHKHIARARDGGQMNAFDTDDAHDYAYVHVTKDQVNTSARDVQGGLEDGYRVNQGYPMYHVLKREADQGAPEGNDAVYSLEDQVTAAQEDPVYALADNDNSDDYALPLKKKHGGVPLHSLAKKTKPEVKKRGPRSPAPPQAATGEGEAVYSLEVKPDVRKRQQYDNTDDYSTPYAHAPGAGYPDDNMMAAKGVPENTADSSDDYSTTYTLALGAKTPDENKMAAWGGKGYVTVADDDEEYSRLQLPKLTDPKTMKNLGKGQKPANVVKAPAPDVDEDDDNDDYYDYGVACDVVVP